MLFPTGTFVAFFVVVFAVSWALARRPSLWKSFIMAASYFFYAFWGWKYALLLAGYTLVNYLLGRVLASATRGRGKLLALAVVLDLLPLVVFKYYSFFAFNLSELFGGWFGLGSALPLLQLVMPVGISFTTFRGISYVVDIYRGQTEKASLLDLGLVHVVLPLPGGRAHRADRRAPAAAQVRGRGRADRRHPGPLPHRPGPGQEGGDRRLPGPQPGRRRLRRSRPVLVARRGDRHPCLRRPDLLRLQRLHRHGHRHRPAARHRAARRTSTGPTRPRRSGISGGAGT